VKKEERIFCVRGTKLAYMPSSSLTDKQHFERHSVLSGVPGVRESAPCARFAGGCCGAGRDIGLQGDGLVVPITGRKGNRGKREQGGKSGGGHGRERVYGVEERGKS